MHHMERNPNIAQSRWSPLHPPKVYKGLEEKPGLEGSFKGQQECLNLQENVVPEGKEILLWTFFHKEGQPHRLYQKPVLKW